MSEVPPLGLTPIINVSGTMTSLGASLASSSVQQATAEIMGHFVQMHELQSYASQVIAQYTGAEAGFFTASASAGISISVAGCLTGLDPGRVEALPRDPGPKPKVVIQVGHLCHYGAPVSQSIEITGAEVLPVGQSTLCTDYALEAAMKLQVSSALYVVSHHVVHYGQVPLDRFIKIAQAANVPVIVDTASEYNLRKFIATGADLVIYSGHKFLGGPTSGVVAGKRDLVRAAYLQNAGIGRGMKIGKESIAGAIVALQNWGTRDHAMIREQENAALNLWQSELESIEGVEVQIVPDPTSNPLSRLEIQINSKVLGADAAAVAVALTKSNVPIFVRSHEVELGYFQLDPCNLKPGQAEIVAKTLKDLLTDRETLNSLPKECDNKRNGGINGFLTWGT